MIFGGVFRGCYFSKIQYKCLIHHQKKLQVKFKGNAKSASQNSRIHVQNNKRIPSIISICFMNAKCYILSDMEIDEIVHLQGFIPKSSCRLNRSFFVL